MRVVIAVLMTVFLGLGSASSVFANCGSCGADKAKGSECGKKSEEMVKKFDKDGDGKLNDAEKTAAKEAKKAEHEKKMLEKFDTDKDGKLSDAEKAEMQKACDTLKAEKKCKGEKKAEDKK